jgi:vancomycin resistance protein VanW
LLGGELVVDFGGGLCQLSGVLYWLSLKAGLTILERHPHSRDIYRDHDRYAPLGADATVAYGFKDLRILNNLAAAICFRVSIDRDTMSASLCSTTHIEPCDVDFVQIAADDGVRTVETRRRFPGEKEYRAQSVSTYRKLSTPTGFPPRV